VARCGAIVRDFRVPFDNPPKAARPVRGAGAFRNQAERDLRMAKTKQKISGT